MTLIGSVCIALLLYLCTAISFFSGFIFGGLFCLAGAAVLSIVAFLFWSDMGNV